MHLRHMYNLHHIYKPNDPKIWWKVVIPNTSKYPGLQPLPLGSGPSKPQEIPGDRADAAIKLLAGIKKEAGRSKVRWTGEAAVTKML